MITKLYKYDIKKMLRILPYFYVITIVLAGLTRIVNIWNDIQVMLIIGYVLSGATYSAIANVLVNTFVHILATVQGGFYKDESYLTHTLPVTKKQLLTAKYLSALTVIIASILVCFLSLFTMFYSKELIATLKVYLDATITGINISSGLFITLIAIILFAEICTFISMAFAAIIKGHSYNNKKGGKSFLWFAIFYVISTSVTVIMAVIVFAIGGMLPELIAETLSGKALITIIILGLILYVGYAVAFYFISQKIFNKGVNVD
ncbi:MAG: hypothetical protein IJZ73_05655 [Clostridia bacterium]|nr:hypothetical protein [Clostridia bacterium]